MTQQRPRKHSLNLRGHQTSVSLEDPFWLAFREIAKQRGVPLNELAARIDAKRGMDMGLASAIRLFVLRDCQDQLARLRDEGNTDETERS